MPITKSAKKSLRKEGRRKALNMGNKKSVKDLKKQILSLVKENKKKEAQGLLGKYYKKVDKSAKAGTIKKNTANRKKARMAKAVTETQKQKL